MIVAEALSHNCFIFVYFGWNIWEQQSCRITKHHICKDWHATENICFESPAQASVMCSKISGFDFNVVIEKKIKKKLYYIFSGMHFNPFRE